MRGLNIQQPARPLRNLLDWPEPSHPFITARQEPFVGSDKLYSASLQRRDILPGCRMLPHFPIHGRRNQHFRRRIQCERDARQCVIREPIGHLREHIGRGWSDQQKLRLVGQLNVSRLPAFLLVIKIRHHWMPGQRFENEWCDKLKGIGSHDNPHIPAGLRQQARQISGLVSCDGTSDTKNYLSSSLHILSVNDGLCAAPHCQANIF